MQGSTRRPHQSGIMQERGENLSVPFPMSEECHSYRVWRRAVRRTAKAPCIQSFFFLRPRVSASIPLPLAPIGALVPLQDILEIVARPISKMPMTYGTGSTIGRDAIARGGPVTLQQGAPSCFVSGS